MRTEITGALVVDPASGLESRADLYIADGVVVAIDKAPDGFEAEQHIAAEGLTALPGIVELSARLREPGEEYKATIESEATAAVANGITTLCLPPDTVPVIDSPAVVELIVRRAREVDQARIEVIGALTHGLQSERLAEMYALQQAGCIAVSNAQHTIANSEIMRRALEYANTFDLSVMTQCEDPWLAARRHVHGGASGFSLGLDPIPVAAETIIVARDLLLAEQTGARIHFCRLSTARSVEMIRQAKANGQAVTADVAAHQLFLTEDKLIDFDTRCHVRPPLRTAADRDALRAGLADGTIDALTSDHQPHDTDAKLNPFTETEPGISGLDTLLGLTLSWAQTDDVGLTRAVEALTIAPARIAGLGVGTLATGSPADLTLVDLRAEQVFSEERMVSRGRNNPFRGRRLPGRVRYTFVGGDLKFRADREMEPAQ